MQLIYTVLTIALGVLKGNRIDVIRRLMVAGMEDMINWITVPESVWLCMTISGDVKWVPFCSNVSLMAVGIITKPVDCSQSRKRGFCSDLRILFEYIREHVGRLSVNLGVGDSQEVLGLYLGCASSLLSCKNWSSGPTPWGFLWPCLTRGFYPLNTVPYTVCSSQVDWIDKE